MSERPQIWINGSLLKFSTGPGPKPGILRNMSQDSLTLLFTTLLESDNLTAPQEQMALYLLKASQR